MSAAAPLPGRQTPMPVLANEVDTILHKAATMAAEWLNGHGDRKHKVVEWRSPAELAAELGDLAPRAGGRPLEELLGECRRILARSVRTGHPGFANQLYGGWDLAGLLGEWMTALLDTSMYTYEVAPVLTLIEAEVVKTLARKAGFPDGEGAFAPGGSLANLMAALVARDEKWPQARRKGMPVGVRPVLFVSREAHYSVARAAAVLGFGTDAVRMVDVDARGCMRPRALDRALQIARARGERPFLVVA
ncbi:MAG TPA: pyridoxal-dependent decarboxylase, partial [Planctomycetota bacterium]